MTGTMTSERLVGLYLDRNRGLCRGRTEIERRPHPESPCQGTARALDAERIANGPRSLLQGIPIVLKGNIVIADLPTTAGSSLLAGSLPVDDGFLVTQTPRGRAIILAKLDMSEFASGSALSSLGGPTRNPHDLVRSPAGSSGGTGASIAAAFKLLTTKLGH